MVHHACAAVERASLRPGWGFPHLPTPIGHNQDRRLLGWAIRVPTPYAGVDLTALRSAHEHRRTQCPSQPGRQAVCHRTRDACRPSDAGWWRFLGRWSLFAALNGVVGWTIFVYVSAQGVSIEGERGDLNVALQFPALWRAAMVYDTLAWLFIGATVLTFAAILLRARPILGVLLAAAAIGELFGSMGGCPAAHGQRPAGHYAVAGPDQQAALLQTYHEVWLLVGNRRALARS